MATIITATLTLQEQGIAAVAGYDLITGLRKDKPMDELGRTAVGAHMASIEANADHADAVCFAKVATNDVVFFQDDLLTNGDADRFLGERDLVHIWVEYTSYSIVAIGNVAYIALHLRDESLRRRYMALYRAMMSWSQQLTEITLFDLIRVAIRVTWDRLRLRW